MVTIQTTLSSADQFHLFHLSYWENSPKAAFLEFAQVGAAIVSAPRYAHGLEDAFPLPVREGAQGDVVRRRHVARRDKGREVVNRIKHGAAPA